MSFADLGLSDELLRAVSESGYDSPTPIQRQAIPSILMMRDLIGIAQTGTGKTAAFVLPMIDILGNGRARARMPRSLILEPTRELAAQVAENFVKYGKYHKLNMALLIGGVQMGDQVKALEKGVDVLIATPGRLMDLFERGKILLTGCELLVIDEGDRMLDMGFIPDIEKICTKLPATRQTLLFSATMPAPIKKLADKFLSNPKSIEVARPATANVNITQYWVKVDERKKRDTLRALLRAAPDHSAIVFCNRKTTVRELAKSLKAGGVNAGEIHGDMDQSSRIAELDRFKAGQISVLVASDVAARGLDVKGVSHVFNHDTPWHPDDYIHRIGRTGRAGATGTAYTFVTAKDAEAVENIQKLLGLPIQWLDERDATGGVTTTRDAEHSPVSTATDAADAAPRKRSRAKGATAAKTSAVVADEPAPVVPVADGDTDATPATRAPRRAAKPRVADSAPAQRSAEAPANPNPIATRKRPPSANVADDTVDDGGWNGPMPGFLDFKFGG